MRRNGLAALSLRDLARTVGMRPPSLYSYFDSKNDIYDAMYAQGAQQFVDEQKASMPTPDDPLESGTWGTFSTSSSPATPGCTASTSPAPPVTKSTFGQNTTDGSSPNRRRVGGRHGSPFNLTLTGPAGGKYISGEDGDHITIERGGVLPHALRPADGDRPAFPRGSVLVETHVTEVADGVHQLSTFVDAPVGFKQ